MTMIMSTSTNTIAATATMIKIQTGGPSAVGTATISTKVNPALENRLRAAEL